MNLLNNKKFRIYLILATIALLIIIFCLGFDHEFKKIDSCTGISKKWWIAEYSEFSTVYNTDGSTSIDTDYWDEPASEVWAIKSINGVIYNPKNIPHSDYKGLASITRYPARWENMKRDSAFDNFSKKSSNIYYVTLSDGSTTTENFNMHDKCMSRLDKKVLVKTWYGISISID